MSGASLRAVPAVERVVQTLGPTPLPRPTVVALVREAVAQVRRTGAIPGFEEIVALARSRLEVLQRQRLQPVINGTGVLLHTNLGRAPLGPAALERLARVAGGYCNLELNLDAGERGERGAYLERNLALLCRAEQAAVVNNCAAALVLILRHFTAGEKQEVIVSRGELVQIGGGFRIPEILEASGARLREVGTTNRTSLADYARAFGPRTALVLKVHRSNFFMGGFVASASRPELAALSRRKAVPLVEDLGSGAVVGTEQFAGVEHEPTPAEVLKDGVGLVCFSGDKLLGGPQAGAIAGRRRWVAALKREPLFRALRCDKLVLAALEETVDACLRAGSGRASDEAPVLGLLRLAPGQLRPRAEALVRRLDGLPLDARIGEGRAQFGGGTLPRSSVESVALELAPRGLPLPEFAARLRKSTPPVVGCIAGGRFKLDLRTVFPAQDAELAAAIRAAFGPANPAPAP